MSNEINMKFNASLGSGAKSTFAGLSEGLKKVAKGFQILAKDQISLGKSGVASSLNETAKKLTNLSKQLGDYSKQTNEAVQKTGKFSGIINQLSKSMQTYGRYMVSSSILRGITSGFSSATDSIIDHDQALHDLKAIMGATGEEVKNMEVAILSVAGSTKFSIGETAEAMKLLGQSGFSAGDSINALGPIANLATGTLSTFRSTVDLVSTAIRVFNLQTSDTARVTDIYANAVNKSKLTIDKLNTAMNYIGPIANAAGVSIEETSTAMMLLANTGLRASTIGTGLRRMMTLLLKPTAAFKQAVYDAGYTMDDFNPKMDKFSNIVGKLGNVVGDAEDAVKMFGIRGASVISAFAENGQAEFERLAQAVSQTGTASTMAAEQMKGLAIALKNMKDKFGVLAVAMGKAGFTKAWALLVNSIRAVEDGLITLANSGIGQFVMSTLGLTAAIGSAALGLTLFIKLLSSKMVLLFAAQVAELTAQMLSLSFSMAAFKGATMATSLTNLKTAFAGLGGTIASTTARMASFIAMNPILIGALTVIGVLLSGLIINWMRYTKKLENIVAKNEAISGSLELVRTSIEGYDKILEKNGETSKKYLEIKERLIKTFGQFGSSIKGYTELQNELSEKLKDSTLTSKEYFDIQKQKSDLFGQYLIGNVKKLTNEEKVLREGSLKALDILKNETSSLEEKNEAVKTLSNSIKTTLLTAYSEQANASYELWQRSQRLTNVFQALKDTTAQNFSRPFKVLGGVIDWVANKFAKIPNFTSKAANGIFGVGDSYAYLKRQAEAGNEKAQEALAQIDNYAKSTARLLAETINPLTLTKERIKELADEASKLGKTSPAMIEALVIELQRMGDEANIVANSFKKAFGSDMSMGGQSALSGILYILEQSKNVTADLAKHFQDLSEAGETLKIAGSLEAVQAALSAGKISAKDLKTVFATLFENLPASEWKVFKDGLIHGMGNIKATSEVMSAAIGALTKAAFAEFGLELGKLSSAFSNTSNAFDILLLGKKASMEQLGISFAELGKKVKTLGDLEAITTLFQKMKDSGDITGKHLERSFSVIEEAFKKAFKEPLKEIETARKTVLEAAKGMSVAYGVEATAIESAFTTAYTKIDTEFQILQDKIKNGDKSNLWTSIDMTDSFKQFTSESLGVIEKFRMDSITIFDQQSLAIVSKAKKAGVDVTEIEKKILADKLGIYKTVEEKHKALMDKLIALEKNRRDKVKSLEQDLASIRSSFANESRDMERGQMSDGAAYQDIQKELKGAILELKSAKSGTDEWNSLLSRAKSLAGQLNTEITDGERTIVSKAEGYNNSLKARSSLNKIEIAAKKEAIRLAEDEAAAAKKAQEEVVKKIEQTKKSSEELAKIIGTNLQNSTVQFSDAVDKLVKLLESNSLIIDAENLLKDVKEDLKNLEDDPINLSLDIDEKMDDFFAKLEGIEGAKIEIDPGGLDEAHKNLNSLMDNLLDLQTVEGEITVNDENITNVQQALKDIADTGVTLTMEVLGEDIPLLIDDIDKIKDKKVDIKALVPSQDILTLNKLQIAIDKIKSKRVTIEVNYKTTGKAPSSYKAMGGVVNEDPYSDFKKLNTPLIRKGSGYKDDVPTMLTKGEYVLKKSAVGKLGTRFLNALNAGKFAVSDLISHFQKGGLVAPIAESMFKGLNNVTIPNITDGIVGKKPAITQGVVSGNTSPIMDQLKDFGVMTLDTGKEKFKTIAHKNVIGELTNHLSQIRRFST